MKNKLFYIISLVLFFSCDAFDEIVSELDESEAQLEYDYYIQEGWAAVASQDYSSSVDFFDYLISIYQSSGLSEQITEELIFEAYHGFAWSNLFLSNTFYGDQNSDQRALHRDISYNSFFVSDSIFNSINFSGSDFNYHCDILAGKVLYHDYKIYYYLNQYFEYDGDSQFLDSLSYYSDGEGLVDSNQNGYLELGLEALVSQMNNDCSGYSFQDGYIDINGINMMLIKDYIRKGEYQEAVNFISNLSLNTVNLEINMQIEDSDEVYLMGDFENKVIDSNDLYQLSSGTLNIELTPYLPCNLYSLENQSQLLEDDLRDELLDCVDTYFETSDEIVFRYKYVNGSYDESIYNQETNLSNQCADDEGYRSVVIDMEKLNNPAQYPDYRLFIIEDCFNSCSDSCLDD